MTWRCHDKGRCGEINYKALFRNDSRLIKYSFFEGGNKEKKKTYREVISAKDVPWEVQMDKGGGGQGVGTEWLKKAIHPCNIKKTQAQLPLQETNEVCEFLSMVQQPHQLAGLRLTLCIVPKR